MLFNYLLFSKGIFTMNKKLIALGVLATVFVATTAFADDNSATGSSMQSQQVAGTTGDAAAANNAAVGANNAADAANNAAAGANNAADAANNAAAGANKAAANAGTNPAAAGTDQGMTQEPAKSAQ